MTTTTSTEAYGLKYWIAQTLRTRAFGHTYIHSAARSSANWPWKACEHNGIRFSYTSYGRSLQGGGHKYKVHARFVDNGNPVSSKLLRSI